MKYQFWPRNNPAAVYGAQFGADQQQKLFELAIEHGAGEVWAQPMVDGNRKRAEPDARVGLAIGDGARNALDMLARLAIAQLPSAARELPRSGTLVLLAPELPIDKFATEQRPYGDAALALQCVERVVVLSCPRDVVVAGGTNSLARTPPGAGSHPRVTVVDISQLLECQTDAGYGALCSPEAMALVRRLLLGLSVEAALPGRAKIIKAA